MPGPKRLNEYDCALARTVDLVGDRWSILIIRDAAIGCRRFAEFEVSLGVAKNILSARLKQLVGNGLLVFDDGEYILSRSGWALLPALIALMQWGDCWLFNGAPPVRVTGASGEDIEPVVLRSAAEVTEPCDLGFHATGNATPRTRQFLKMMAVRRGSAAAIADVASCEDQNGSSPCTD